VHSWWFSTVLLFLSLDDADVETVAPILERTADPVQRIKPWLGHKKNLIGQNIASKGEPLWWRGSLLPLGCAQDPNAAISPA
jgi:hypothetical protein